MSMWLSPRIGSRMLFVPRLWAISTASARRMRGGRIGVQRQPRLARRSDRERADLDAVLERRALEGGLRLRIAQGRRLAVGRILHAHLDAVQADLACERDLA